MEYITLEEILKLNVVNNIIAIVNDGKLVRLKRDE